jgi:RimJ/RimL family protein N-acetyltransferase
VWHFAANEAAGRFYQRAGFALDGASRPSSFGVVEVRRSRRAQR